MNNEKLVKNSKTVWAVLKIFEVCCIIGVAVIIVAEVLFAIPATSKTLVGNTNIMNIESFKIILSDTSVVNASSLKTMLIVMLVPYLVYVFIIWYGTKLLEKVVEPMKEGKPFAEGSAAKMKKFGIVIIVGGLFANICKAVSYVFLKESFDFDRIFNKSVVTDCSYDFDLDIGFIVAALVVFMLAYVFSYGESLQIESDETL